MKYALLDRAREVVEDTGGFTVDTNGMWNIWSK
jgi:hypothetical protein